MAISVCMATYEGERFVEHQLQSILGELADNDEVVIVDDCSRDSTVEIIRRLADPRVILHVNEVNRREVYSFSKAIELSRNDVIFMSDQDDIWTSGRVALMVDRLLSANAALVTTNFEWMDALERPISISFDGVSSKDSTRYFKNIADIFIGKTNYFGCAMAFRRALLPLIVPIPEYVESHDLWIALAANLIRSNLHIDERTFRKRRHDFNATSTISARPLLQKLKSREVFARSLIDLTRRWSTLNFARIPL